MEKARDKAQGLEGYQCTLADGSIVTAWVAEDLLTTELLGWDLKVACKEAVERVAEKDIVDGRVHLQGTLLDDVERAASGSR
jgi:hypothetical protein